MYLKRIEIYGFKSFSQRSVLDFDYKKSGNITAVVGPNGSGKSNVADAIRWVTGEQSGKNIRSKKSEDVIFCGSSSKPRGAYAEVTIILSNNEPFSFELANRNYELTEVGISRKLYRNGDSEYLINGKKVRLTDIQQILASLGFGQASYTVIGQGMVDRLLFFTPSERKVLFDEAAGVKQYEIKREQSIRKLESTDSNLIRLTDILGELEPRVANLRRLVKRAEGRKGTEAELKEVQLHYYGSLYNEYRNTVEESETKKKLLNTKIVQIEDSLSRLVSKIAENRQNPNAGKRQIVEQNIALFTKERDALMQEVSYLKGKLESLASNSNSSAQRTRQLAQEKVELAGKVVFLGNKVAEELEAIASLDNEYTETEKQLNLSLEEVAALDEKLTAPVGNDLKKAGEVREKLNDLEQKRQEVSGEIFANRQQISYAKSQQEETARRTKRAQDDLKLLREQLEQNDSETKKLGSSLSEVRGELQTIESTIKSKQQLVERAEKELSNLVEQVDPKSLSELEAELKGLSKSKDAMLANFSTVTKVEQLESAKRELTVFGVNVTKIFDKFLGITRAINSAEREKLEGAIRAQRVELNIANSKSSQLGIRTAKLQADFESRADRATEISKRIVEKESELKDFKVSNNAEEENLNLGLLESKLQKITVEIAALQLEEKKYSGAVSEHQNAILKQKDQLQIVISERRHQMHRLELDISMKNAVVENQQAEIEQANDKLRGTEEALQALAKEPVSSADNEIQANLKARERELSKADERLAKERGALVQIMEAEKEFEQSTYALESETRELQESRNNVSRELSNLEVEAAKTSVRLEDLTEEIKNADVELPKSAKFEAMDQMEKDVLKLKVENLKRKLDVTIGIDPETESEYNELEARSTEMATQINDLTKAKSDLEKVIKELDVKIKDQFSDVFKGIAAEFNRYFKLLFNGGSANLSLGEDAEGGFGIEIAANPPGKRIQSLHALSGGERTLTSLALLFAILSVNPSPFIMLDEVDAALDESNTNRFLKILDDLAKKTQFIIITHNRDTMKAASSLYGVTMSDEHISKLLSVKLTEAIAAVK